MPALGQRQRHYGVAVLVCRAYRSGQHAIDENVAARLRRLDIQRIYAARDPPLAAPPHRERQLIVTGVGDLEQAVARVVVEEVQRQVRSAVNEMQSCVDAGEW